MKKILRLRSGGFLTLAFAGGLAGAAKNPPPAPTFNRDVAPILYRECAACHRPGEVAPFSLLTYQDAAKHAPLITTVTASRLMPPWKPEPGYGEFQDTHRLTDTEIATIQAWAKAGTPEGDPADRPAPPKFAEGWQLGEPDLVVEMPEPFSVPAGGPDIYQCFVLPLNLTEDREVTAVEFRPGNRKVVHHAIFYLDSFGNARGKDAGDPDPGYKCFGGPGVLPTGGLGGWAPGVRPRFLPEGVARPLPKGSDLIIQSHYHPTGKPESDRSTLGIHFSKAHAAKTVISLPLVKRDLHIPAGEKRHSERVSFTMPIDLQAIGIIPHMHLLGREMKVTATLPDGGSRPLIWIRDWDFNWQGHYTYARPVELPKGSRIDLEAIYDNSSGNPRNPHDPPREVKWGEQTTDEMAIAFIQFQTDHRGDQLTLWRSLNEQLGLWKSRK